VVAIGAPLGALICSYMPRRAIVLLLLFLIGLEFLSTLLLVPMSRASLFSSAVTLAICACVTWAMSRATRYRPDNFPGVPLQETVETPEAIA
ncbi:MAG TPA: sulfite exporter TauE/SafE family protein, partial [Acidobacteriaceae bacterium]